MDTRRIQIHGLKCLMDFGMPGHCLKRAHCWAIHFPLLRKRFMVGLSEFWRWPMLQLGIILLPFYWVMQKATGFEHGSEQETAPWKVRIGVKAVHPSRLSHSAELAALELLSQRSRLFPESPRSLLGLWSDAMSSAVLDVYKAALDILLSPRRLVTWHGPSHEHASGVVHPCPGDFQALHHTVGQRNGGTCSVQMVHSGTNAGSFSGHRKLCDRWPRLLVTSLCCITASSVALTYGLLRSTDKKTPKL